MNDETLKKYVHAIADDYFTRNKPHPNVDVSLCSVCNRMTSNWYTNWPKSKLIIWMCEECQQKRSEQSHKLLEDQLEKMCDEH